MADTSGVGDGSAAALPFSPSYGALGAPARDHTSARGGAVDSNLMGLLLDEGDAGDDGDGDGDGDGDATTMGMGSISQTQIIERQAETIAHLEASADRARAYKTTTKVKLKEAAQRLREYRLRVESLMAELSAAKGETSKLKAQHRRELQAATKQREAAAAAGTAAGMRRPSKAKTVSIAVQTEAYRGPERGAVENKSVGVQVEGQAPVVQQTVAATQTMPVKVMEVAVSADASGLPKEHAQAHEKIRRIPEAAIRVDAPSGLGPIAAAPVTTLVNDSVSALIDAELDGSSDEEDDGDGDQRALTGADALKGQMVRETPQLLPLTIDDAVSREIDLELELSSSSSSSSSGSGDDSDGDDGDGDDNGNGNGSRAVMENDKVVAGGSTVLKAEERMQSVTIPAILGRTNQAVNKVTGDAPGERAKLDADEISAAIDAELESTSDDDDDASIGISEGVGEFASFDRNATDIADVNTMDDQPSETGFKTKEIVTGTENYVTTPSKVVALNALHAEDTVRSAIDQEMDMSSEEVPEDDKRMTTEEVETNGKIDTPSSSTRMKLGLESQPPSDSTTQSRSTLNTIEFPDSSVDSDPQCVLKENVGEIAAKSFMRGNSNGDTSADDNDLMDVSQENATTAAIPGGMTVNNENGDHASESEVGVPETEREMEGQLDHDTVDNASCDSTGSIPLKEQGNGVQLDSPTGNTTHKPSGDTQSPVRPAIVVSGTRSGVKGIPSQVSGVDAVHTKVDSVLAVKRPSGGIHPHESDHENDKFESPPSKKQRILLNALPLSRGGELATQSKGGPELTNTTHKDDAVPDAPMPSKPDPPANHPSNKIVMAFKHSIAVQDGEERDACYVARSLSALIKTVNPYVHVQPLFVKTLCKIVGGVYSRYDIAPMVITQGIVRVARTPRARLAGGIDVADLSNLFRRVICYRLHCSSDDKTEDHDGSNEPSAEITHEVSECLQILRDFALPGHLDNGLAMALENKRSGGITKNTSAGADAAKSSAVADQMRANVRLVESWPRKPAVMNHNTTCLALLCGLHASICLAVQQVRISRVLLFDVLKSHLNIRGLYIIHTMVRIAPALLAADWWCDRPTDSSHNSVSLIREAVLHTILIVTYRSGEKRETLFTKSSVAYLSMISATLQLPLLMEVDVASPRYMTEFVTRVRGEYLSPSVLQIVNKSPESRVLEYYAFEAAMMLELLVVTHGAQFVTEYLSLATLIEIIPGEAETSEQQQYQGIVLVARMVGGISRGLLTHVNAESSKVNDPSTSGAEQEFLDGAIMWMVHALGQCEHVDGVDAVLVSEIVSVLLLACVKSTPHWRWTLATKSLRILLKHFSRDRLSKLPASVLRQLRLMVVCSHPISDVVSSERRT